MREPVGRRKRLPHFPLRGEGNSVVVFIVIALARLEKVSQPWLFGCQENDDRGAADHQVGGSFPGVVAFARFDAAVDHGTAVITGSAEAEFSERSAAGDLGELQADYGSVELEALGRPGTVRVILDNPELRRIGGARVAGLLPTHRPMGRKL